MQDKKIPTFARIAIFKSSKERGAGVAVQWDSENVIRLKEASSSHVLVQ